MATISSTFRCCGQFGQSVVRFNAPEMANVNIRGYRTARKQFRASCPRSVHPSSERLQKYTVSAVHSLPEAKKKLFVPLRYIPGWPSDEGSRELEKIIRRRTSRSAPPLGHTTWTSAGQRTEHRFSRGLHPNARLEEHRKRPIYAPECVRTTLAMQSAATSNAERLDNLWKLSTAHGVSWDRIDALYMMFMETYGKCLQMFSENEPELRKEAGRLAQHITVDMRRQYFKNKNISIETIPAYSPVLRPRSYVWPLARLIFYRWKKAYLKPFQRGALTRILRAYCLRSILTRETHERYLNILHINPDQPTSSLLTTHAQGVIVTGKTSSVTDGVTGPSKPSAPKSIRALFREPRDRHYLSEGRKGWKPQSVVKNIDSE